MNNEELNSSSTPLSWRSIYDRFVALMPKTGREKESSYMMSVYFYPDTGDIISCLGTYDIPNWGRYTNIGPFKLEEEAMQATLSEVIKAEASVRLWMEDQEVCE